MKSSCNDQSENPKGAVNLVIGTPGRVCGMLANVEISPNLVNIGALQLLVFDEADRLLQLGFEKDVLEIVKRMPITRQTALFSATSAYESWLISKARLRYPIRVIAEVFNNETRNENIQLGNQGLSVPSTLKNHVIELENDMKFLWLVEYLTGPALNCKMMIYVSTCAMADYLSIILEALIPTEGQGRDQISNQNRTRIWKLHRKMQPEKRAKMYREFISHSQGVLLCTDITARGVDIPDVDVIIQLEAPKDPEMFVHRVGRVSRMGKAGLAILLLTPSERKFIEYLRIHKVSLSTKPPPIPKADGLDAEREGLKLSPLEASRALQRLAVGDRAVMLKAQEAFVASVRAYKEHKLSYIFSFSSFDWAGLARGLGLLRLPLIPDLKRLNIRFLPAPIDMSQIAFKDPQRESEREALLQEKHRKNEEEKARRVRVEVEKYKAKKKRDAERRLRPDLQRRLRSKQRQKTRARESNRVERLKEDTKMKRQKGEITEEEYQRVLESVKACDLRYDSNYWNADEYEGDKLKPKARQKLYKKLIGSDALSKGLVTVQG
ncbi:hypothetical protein AAMO2058_000029200 [Amorphochlora amoebiformis]